MSSKNSPYNLVYWGVALAFAAVAWHAHLAASLTLPIPWGDEAYFVWQARAFENGNAFVAPELDSKRPIFLLPFVYQGVLGVAFKVMGFSLENARHVSFAFILVGFGFLAAAVRRHAASIGALCLIGCFLLNGHFVVMGNVARMEAMLFALICACLFLLERKRHWLALAILLSSLMVHPNGIFYLIPVVAYSAAKGVRREPLTKTAVAAFAIAAFVWIANGAYSLSYWSGFVHDTALRLGETSAAHRGASQFGGWHAVGLGGIIAITILGARFRAETGHFMTIALGAWFHYRVRLEQWYDPFGDFAYLLLSLGILELVPRLAEAVKLNSIRHLRLATTTVVSLGLIAFHLAAKRVEGPRNYLHDLSVAGMRIEDEVPYFSPSDLDSIRAILNQVYPEQPIVVEVYPWGDGLLLAGLDKRIQYRVPYFDNLFFPPRQWAWGYGPTVYPTADVYLVHCSRYHPEWLDYRHALVLERALTKSGYPSGPDQTQLLEQAVICRRDNTEVWYAIRPSDKPNGMRTSVQGTQSVPKPFDQPR